MDVHKLEAWQNGTLKAFDACVGLGCSVDEALDRMSKVLCVQHGVNDGYYAKNRATAIQCMVTTLLARELGLPVVDFLDFTRFEFLYTRPV